MNVRNSVYFESTGRWKDGDGWSPHYWHTSNGNGFGCGSPIMAADEFSKNGNGTGMGVYVIHSVSQDHEILVVVLDGSDSLFTDWS